MTIGETIRSTRKKRNITQKKLSELSGVAEITIRQYEAGKYKPKSETLMKIASALQVSPDKIDTTYWNNFKDIVPIVNQIADIESIEDNSNVASAIVSTYGDDVAKVFYDFLSLNDEGQQKIRDYISDLIEMKKYKK